MLCQICRKRIASITVKEKVSGQVKSLNLCHVCASDREFLNNSSVLGDSLFNSFFGNNKDSNATSGSGMGQPTSQPKRINILDYFSDRAKEVVEDSIDRAREFNSKYVDTEHILLGLLDEEIASQLLTDLGIKTDDLQKYLEKNIVEGTGDEDKEPEFSSRAKKVLELAFYAARDMGHNYVGSEHIILGLTAEGEGMAAQVLSKYNVDQNKVSDLLKKKLGKSKNKHEKSNTPTLDKYSVDLTVQAKEGKIDPIIGRVDEVTRVIQVLSRRTKNNPVLIGEPGVGKTAIAEGLAQQIVLGSVPETLKKKRVVSLDISQMLAGTKFRGEFEKRMKKILKEVKDAKKDIILFIDELHMVVGAGATEGSIDASNMLKPALARGELQAIGATTLDEYRKHIEKDAALERRFQPVIVAEPTINTTIEILRGIRDKYEAHHKVRITNESIIAAVTLSDRYITDRFLPDKAIDLIDEAAAKIRLTSITAPEKLKELENEIIKLRKEKEAAEGIKNRRKALSLDKELKEKKLEKEKVKEAWNKSKGISEPEVISKDIEEIVASWTKIPVSQISEEEGEKLLKLEKRLHEKIIGQEEAVKAVSSCIRRGRAGLSDPKRPIGSFIFLGPTGVGKTELAKSLAYLLFSDEESMIRLDMSEYMERHTVSKLIGSPPGYVGHEEGGQLTEAVRRKPYSVVLLDEIEKAHPDVFNSLLQILEDGRLTDSKGRTVDFRNIVLIATSNIGSQLISDASDNNIGFDKDKSTQTLEERDGFEGVKNQLMGELKKYFKPEFLNRIDDIIVFHSLNKKQIKKIVDIMLCEVKKLLRGQNIEIDIDNKVKTILTKEGYDPTFGARPLRRVIQKRLEDPLSEMLLSGDFNNGDKIKATADKNKNINFKIVKKRKRKLQKVV